MSAAGHRSGRGADVRRAATAAAAVLVALAVPTAPSGATAPTPSTSPSATPVAWDDRGSIVLSAPEALTALRDLPADSPAAVSWGEGGSRTGWFGEAWEDVDGDGCDTRNEILGRDLDSVDYSRADGVQSLAQGRGEGVSSCPDATVYAGTLHDPYTGSTIAFTRGKDTSAAVQIDHVVPLNYLYAHGAWAWDERTRLLVANDPLNLLSVDGEANQGKGACGPATCPVGSTETDSWDTASGEGWWPPDGTERCAYAERFVSVLAAYGLGVPQADHDALATTLRSCATGGDGAPSILERTGPVITSTGDLLLHRHQYTAALVAGLLLIGAGVVARARRPLRRR
nr:HNH endonuclease family protein [Actinomyces radicidentis]